MKRLRFGRQRRRLKRMYFTFVLIWFVAGLATSGTIPFGVAIPIILGLELFIVGTIFKYERNKEHGRSSRHRELEQRINLNKI